MARTVEHDLQRAEAPLHRRFGDLVPDRRAIVETERVVDGGAEVKAAADDRDDLAIAHIAHAFDHVPGLVGRLRAGRGDGGGGEYDKDDAAQDADRNSVVGHGRLSLRRWQQSYVTRSRRGNKAT